MVSTGTEAIAAPGEAAMGLAQSYSSSAGRQGSRGGAGSLPGHAILSWGLTDEPPNAWPVFRKQSPRLDNLTSNTHPLAETGSLRFFHVKSSHGDI